MKDGRRMIDFSVRGLKQILASELLSSAEYCALNDYKQASRGHDSFKSDIYGAGSEFSLCCAEAQLMGAVVGVLNETLTEALKGFYKMRKAYLTLEAIFAEETSYKKRLAAHGTEKVLGGLGESKYPRDTASLASAFEETGEEYDVEHDSLSDDFEDAKEHVEQTLPIQEYNGNIELNGVLRYQGVGSMSAPTTRRRAFISRSDRGNYVPESSLETRREPSKTPELSSFDHPIDAFIHSGTNMCFGLLLLILSMIPPAFAKLLYIIGFQGDRERGLRMLWQATEYENINGATAGLVLLSYNNTFLSFCDILPDGKGKLAKHADDISNTEESAQRLEALLHEMRRRYPNSCLWVIEEARMYARKRKLHSGIDLLTERGHSALKQVHALAQFEKSLQTLYAHQYCLCADAFTSCCELNNWSHALYLYLAGCCHIQLYRDSRARDDPSQASKHAQTATELFARSQSNTGKKKVLSRPLPLEAYVIRKMTKWEARAKANEVPLVDAVGAAPCEEMMYHFGGFQKMDAQQAQRSMENLQQSEDLQKQGFALESTDEAAMVAVLRAAVLRSSDRRAEAIKTLEEDVLTRDSSLFKGSSREDWVLPVGHYEMAANLWASRQEADACPGPEKKIDDTRLVRKAQVHLEKAAKWGSYDLEARMGMRITMGLNTVKAWLEDQKE